MKYKVLCVEGSNGNEWYLTDIDNSGIPEWVDTAEGGEKVFSREVALEKIKILKEIFDINEAVGQFYLEDENGNTELV